MKIITEPTVHLVASSVINQPEFSKFLSTIDADKFEPNGTHSDVIPELGGRLCYLSFNKPRPGGNAGYIRHILKEGHGSVLEHSTYSLIFQGVSRSLTHQFVRQRAGMGYSQLSERFVDESDCSFVVPPLLLDDVKAAMGWVERNKEAVSIEDYTDAYERAVSVEQTSDAAWPVIRGLEWLSGRERNIDEYNRLVSRLDRTLPASNEKTSRRKEIREAARSVLPNCTETKIFVTGNGRSWRHFLEMRGSLGADAEIRRLALAVLPVLRGVSPVLFGDYEVKTSEDGIRYIHTDYRKV